MSRAIDNIIAFKVLYMLVKNFKDTEAYKLGIIDEKGKVLKKSSQLTTTQEKEAYTYLHRLVFNMKKIINKIGGESKLKSLVTALFLVKEYYESNNRNYSLMEERYSHLMTLDLTLVEEELMVEKFVEEDGAAGAAPAGGAPTNSTGAAVSTDQPVIKLKDIKKYQAKNASGALSMARRNNKLL